MAEPAPLAHQSLVMIGAGGHARVVAEALSLQGLALAGHVAPEADESGRLELHLGDDSALPWLAQQGCRFALGLGFVNAAGAARRAALLETLAGLGAELVTVLHPAAIIAPSAALGPGCFVAAGAVVGTLSRIGRGGLVNTGAIIDHDAVIGDNCHIATGARLAGGIHCGGDVLIGAGAVLRQAVQIGATAVIGAGAVVLRNVPAGATMVGNPARPLLRETEMLR